VINAIAAMEREQQDYELDYDEIQPFLRNANDEAVTRAVHACFKEKWKSKSGFTCSMARHLIEDVHQPFRDSFARLLENDHVDVPSFNRLNSSLHHHHSLEDSWFFPKMVRQHPSLKDEIAILENDHKVLVTLEEEVNDGNFESLKKFVSLLLDHLNREELLIVPYLRG
jgi:iron-sulfur cluster repair protein YtfE (RIC family)